MVCDKSQKNDEGGGPRQDPTERQDPTLIVQGETSNHDNTVQVPRWCCWCLIGLVAILVSAVMVACMVMSHQPRFYVPAETLESMGVEAVIMFRQYDRDSDGVLSLDEFEPLAHRLLELNETYNYDQDITETSEVLTISASFKPLHLSSMSHDTNKNVRGLDPLWGLKRWKSAAHSWKNFAASDFVHFLPRDKLLATKVGHVYRLAGLPPDMDMGITLSSNRYFPPRLINPSEILIHRILSMFHDRPFVIGRFGPHGALACIKAVNSKFIQIVFRIHAEFQLNDPPFHPFWFTPSQFKGQLIISRDFRHVHYFECHIPTDRKVNVDMEFLTGPRSGGVDSMEVDIGFIGEMLLETKYPSMLAVEDGIDRRSEPVVDNTTDLAMDNIQWEREITFDEAYHKIDVRFYPFKKVPYYTIPEAFKKAEAENKLVHSVVLWGALDDQSC